VKKFAVGDEDTVRVDVVQLSTSGVFGVSMTLPSDAGNVFAMECLDAARLAKGVADAAAKALKLNQDAGLMPPNPPVIVLPRSH
jgi:hypothetical protein